MYNTNFTLSKKRCSRLVERGFRRVGGARVPGGGVACCHYCWLTVSVCCHCLCVLWSVSKADAHSGHPPALGHRHPDEQRHAYAGARRRVRLRVPGREGLHQLLLLLRGLPLRGLAPRPTAHPRRQDRLICAHLLSHCLRPLQPGLLGLLPVPLGHAPLSPSLSFLLTL